MPPHHLSALSVQTAQNGGNNSELVSNDSWKAWVSLGNSFRIPPPLPQQKVGSPSNAITRKQNINHNNTELSFNDPKQCMGAKVVEREYP